jgi:serine/threonine protein kinase
MIACPSCHAENEDDAEACFGCGGSFATRVTLGTVIASRYEVLSRLGRGGMGTVYKVRDTALNVAVALKILRPDIARSVSSVERRFRAEFKLARRVTHPNVCRLYDYIEDGDLKCISMELIEGTQLRQLARERSLSRAVAHDYALQIAAGLTAIHEAGIVHRDLKTANIMVDQAGVLKLMDFGIARPMQGNVTRDATTTGGVVGTPEYMSPEQARGDPVDARSDLYSMGVVLFEIFTGDVPFHGDSPVATVIKQLNESPPLTGTSGLPLALVPVVRKALAKYPPHRFQSTGELIDALQRARSPLLAGTGPALSQPLKPSPPVEDPLALIAPPNAERPMRQAKRPGLDLPSLIARGATPKPVSDVPVERVTHTVWFWVRFNLVLMVVVWFVLETTMFRSCNGTKNDGRGGQPGAGPPPEPIALLDPREGAEIVNSEGCVRLTWAARPKASYGLRVTRDAPFGPPVVVERGLTNALVELRGLTPGEYCWQVWAEGPDGKEGPAMTGRFFMHTSSESIPPPFLSFDVQHRGEYDILVSGRTEPGATVAVNGLTIVTQSDGSFSHVAQMGSGQQITVRAVTPNCGVNEQTRVIVVYPDRLEAK